MLLYSNNYNVVGKSRIPLQLRSVLLLKKHLPFQLHGDHQQHPKRLRQHPGGRDIVMLTKLKPLPTDQHNIHAQHAPNACPHRLSISSATAATRQSLNIPPQITRYDEGP